MLIKRPGIYRRTDGHIVAVIGKTDHAQFPILVFSQINNEISSVEVEAYTINGMKSSLSTSVYDLVEYLGPHTEFGALQFKYS